jgi:hypothetical protein
MQVYILSELFDVDTDKAGYLMLQFYQWSGLSVPYSGKLASQVYCVPNFAPKAVGTRSVAVACGGYARSLQLVDPTSVE